MGSAAPSRRRWILALAVLAGVGALALVAWPGASTNPPAGVGPDEVAGGGTGSTDRTVVDVAGSRGRVVTVPVVLTPGWLVPDLDEEGHGHAHSEGLEVARAPGSETVGASIDVVAGAESFVVRSTTGRSLAVRARAAGAWSPWRAVDIGRDEAPDGLDGEEGAATEMPAGVPVLLTPGSTAVEIVDRSGSDEPIELVFLPAFDGPVDASFDDPAGPAVAGAGAPAVLPRSAWTSAPWASANGSCGDGPSTADHLQAVIVHHTVTANDYGPDQVDDLLRAIHYSHTEINGWCDIGYNFVVDRFGRVWEARTDSATRSVIGGHARGFNTGTVGVALLGQHHAGAWPAASSVSTAARDAVQAVADWKLGAEGVDPNGRTWLRNRSSASRQRLAAESWHYVPTVLGHRDVGLTSCPGSFGMDVVGALPDRLAAQRDVSLPYQWTGWRPHGHGPAFAIADARGGLRPAGTAEPWSGAPAGVGANGAAIAVGGNVAGGYLLTASGTLLPYGSAPGTPSPVAAGGPIDLVVRADGASGWVLDGSGTMRGFGGAPDLGPDAAVVQPIAADLDDEGRGYILEASGRLVPVGGVALDRVDPVAGAGLVDLSLKGGSGGWVLDRAGRLLGFGGQPDRRVEPAATPVAVAAAPTEDGGWVLDAQGQLWPFGGARYVFPVVTDARSADAVDLDGVGLVYRPEFLDGGDARFVRRLHQLFLGRGASEVEIDRAVTALEQGSDRVDLTTPLARSDHWAGSTLDQMYRDVLGREPDPEGRAYWMGQIGQGLRLEDLGTYFYGSAEYAAAAGSDEAYVRGLYNALLRRPPDDEGLRYWTGELASGRAGPPDIAAGFYVSVESRRDRAGRLYRQVFGADASTARRDELADRLGAIGDVALAAELAAGSDFYRLAAQS